MYNATQSILSTINSILNQSLAVDEIIVVDDASSDDSVAKVLAKYGHQIKLIQQSQNQGPSAARNIGWKAATCDYVAFLDADDSWYTDRMEIVKQCLIAHPQIDFLWNRYTHEFSQYEHIIYSDKDLKKTSLFELCVTNPIAPSASVIKRDRYILFNENMRYSEDYEWVYRAKAMCNMYEIHLPLTFRERPMMASGGQSEKLWKMRKGEIKSYVKLCQLYPLMILAFPFLVTWSIFKHFRLLLTKRRKLKGTRS